jgi:riboflavin kinase / FMN adenylyltransferase
VRESHLLVSRQLPRTKGMVFRSLAEFRDRRPPGNPALVIGNLDGVHVGHQALLRSSQESLGSISAVLTFSPHPQEVLSPDLAVGHRLTTDDEKFSLLNGLGVEWVLALPFTKELSNQEPEDFVKQVLLETLQVASLHIGEDFRFGKKRQGDVDLLRHLLGGKPDRLHLVQAVLQESERVSSSLIRELLRRGDVASAARRLGRPYRMSGKVVSGSGRGQTIGVPTANVAYPKQKLPPRHGVYASQVVWNQRRFPSITNFGVRPTFGHDVEPFLETHLFGFSSDLYGAEISIDFIDWIREERRFKSVEELKEQVLKDSEVAKVKGAVGV